MTKTYRYKNLVFPLGDEEMANFTVEFISDGNIGSTGINVPGEKDYEIINAGSEKIGKGVDLRNEFTVVATDVSNMNPMEEEIRIRYKINGKLLLEHHNLKSESNEPMIVLAIKFPSL